LRVQTLKPGNPALDFLAAKEERDSGGGADRVVSTLGVPCGDVRVHQGIGKCEKHFDVIVESVLIASGDEFGEARPVHDRRVGIGAGSPVFGNRFLFIGEVAAEPDQFFGLLLIFGRAEFHQTRIELGTQLVAFAEGERRDEGPVSAGEHLQDEIAVRVGVGERLPVVRIEGLRKSGVRGKGSGCIESCVARPIAVGARVPATRLPSCLSNRCISPS